MQENYIRKRINAIVFLRQPIIFLRHSIKIDVILLSEKQVIDNTRFVSANISLDVQMANAQTNVCWLCINY